MHRSLRSKHSETISTQGTKENWVCVEPDFLGNKVLEFSPKEI